jgi:hypothetical protein
MDSWFFPFFSPPLLILPIQGLEEAKDLAGKCPPPDPNRLSDAEFSKNLANLSNQFAVSAHRRFEFNKRRQLFIGVHNETLSVAAMRIGNDESSSVGIPSKTHS